MTEEQIIAGLVKPADWCKQVARDGGPMWTFKHYAISVTSREQYGVSPGIGIFPTLAAAQAAAEADYRARIAAALDVGPILALVGAATPYVSPVQNADYGRQLRQHEALVAALAAFKEASHG